MDIARTDGACDEWVEVASISITNRLTGSYLVTKAAVTMSSAEMRWSIM